MAFSSTVGTNPITLRMALENAMAIAGNIKTAAINLLALAQSTGIPANQILNLPQNWTQANTQLSVYSALPGMAAFAQAQLGDANVAADFAAMQSAITAAVNWITTNFPVDSNNYLECVTFAANGAAVFTYG